MAMVNLDPALIPLETIRLKRGKRASSASSCVRIVLVPFSSYSRASCRLLLVSRAIAGGGKEQSPALGSSILRHVTLPLLFLLPTPFLLNPRDPRPPIASPARRHRSSSSDHIAATAPLWRRHHHPVPALVSSAAAAAGPHPSSTSALHPLVLLLSPQPKPPPPLPPPISRLRYSSLFHLFSLTANPSPPLPLALRRRQSFCSSSISTPLPYPLARPVLPANPRVVERERVEAYPTRFDPTLPFPLSPAAGTTPSPLPATMSGDADQVCSFFRKPTKNKNIRKRRSEEDDEGKSDEGGSTLQKPKKTLTAAADNKLHFSTSRPKPKHTDEDDTPASSSAVFQFDSSKEIQVHHDSKATATLETETEFDRDARAIRERVLKQAEEALKRGSGGGGDAKSDDKVYRGIHGYTDYKAGFRREHTVAGEKAGGSHGPLRASAHIRLSTRFDYQPDICKDYKETGYCGFGDACKFMHDRGDYKSGWQLEKEWEEKEKARKRALAMGGGDGDDGEEDDEDEDDDNELPFACFICRQPFEDPVMTKCKHYFCEHCALKHHSKNKKCFVCNKPTLGIFNTAHEIRKKMAEQK